MVGVTLCGFDVGGWGCVGLCFVAAAPGCGVVVVALPGCGAFLGCCGWVWGVVCELDSVFVFYACFLFLFGEFDPGSGRTLAACLTHASRTMMRCLHR